MRRMLRLALAAVIGLALVALLALPVLTPAIERWRLDRQAEDTAHAQQELARQVPAAVRVYGPQAPRHVPPPTATPVGYGEALATLRIPRFGADWEWTIAEGIGLDVIDNGPGHFPGTAWPGQRGNSAYAAHRAGHGDPFIDFELLRPGDRVTIEQRGTRWVYELTMRPAIIDIHDVWILDHTAGRQITLTTCWPKWGSSRRMYVRGRLVEYR